MNNVMKNIAPIGLSIGIVLGINGVANAHSMNIDSSSDFYNYYDPNNTVFTSPQKSIIDGIFENINPYLGANGLKKAIANGYIPLTQELIGHGTHWFNPKLVDLTNIKATATSPAGLNFDKNGHLAAVFWAQELYQPLASLVQNIKESVGLENINPATLTQSYSQYKQDTLQIKPTIFNDFSQAMWHHHENVVLENLGAKNSQGELDPSLTKLRQSLSNENFVNELLTGLGNPQIVVAPLESDSSLGYPPYNRAMSPGFYMLHMWLGRGNHSGLFAETNPDISVSENAISEGLTFEDGSDGHDSGMGGGHSGHSVPEPLTILGAGAAMGFGAYFKRKLAKKNKQNKAD